MRSGGGRGEQRLVGEDVDAPRESFRSLRDDSQHLRPEELRSAVTRRAQPEIDVILDVAGRERRERERVCDALTQLAHVRKRKVLLELGLAEKHDLQQLL